MRWIVLCTLLGISHAHAGPVSVLDFNDFGGDYYVSESVLPHVCDNVDCDPEPWVEDGYQITLQSCFVTGMSGTGFPGSDGTTGLGTGVSGCTDFSVPGQFQIDRFGERFDLLGILNFLNSPIDLITSSNGGAFSPLFNEPAFFDGAEWRNIEWLRFSHGGTLGGVDNIVVQAVAEPTTLSLMIIGLAGFLFCRQAGRSGDGLGPRPGFSPPK